MKHPTPSLMPSWKKTAAAFTLMELLVVIGIMAVLMALAMPVVTAVREKAKITQCASNLRQIGVAANAYASDHNGYYPAMPTAGPMLYFISGMPAGKATWTYFGVLYEEGYVSDGRVFYCPAMAPGTFDYASQWPPNVRGLSFTQMFRIGYLQRPINAFQNTPAAGVLTRQEGRLRVLMLDHNYNSGHPIVSQTKFRDSYPRGINVLFNDSHVYYDASGEFWYSQNYDQACKAWESGN